MDPTTDPTTDTASSIELRFKFDGSIVTAAAVEHADVTKDSNSIFDGSNNPIIMRIRDKDGVETRYSNRFKRWK